MFRLANSLKRTLLVSLFLITTSLIFLYWFKVQSRPVSSQSTRTINLTIQRGKSLDQIGRSLKEKEVIRSVPAFKIQAALSGLSRSLQAGNYRLSPHLSLKETITHLTQGSSDRWVTILEGWRREQIAQELVNKLSKNNPDYQFDPQQFLQLTQNYKGKLYPDTYAFSPDTTSQGVFDRLYKNYRDHIRGLSNSTTLSDQQALILASLIERESADNKERPIIGGILYKRLQNGWPLQVDATVQYAKAKRNCQVLTCNWWSQNLTKQDIQLNSPYNTYNQPGLPPTPIANPSLSSIKAAYNPTQTPYWYYLHEPSGKVHFSKTLSEHNQNVKQHLNK